MLRKKGQNIAEYSIVIALVIAAAVAMQVYVRKGLQGRVQQAMNYTGGINATSAGFNFTGAHYEPTYVTSLGNITSQFDYNETTGARGNITRTGIKEITTREINATETIAANTTQ